MLGSNDLQQLPAYSAVTAIPVITMQRQNEFVMARV